MITVSLTSRIPEIIGDLDPDSAELKAALQAGAESIAEAAQERVPVDTGTLRDAIHVEEIEGGYSVVAGNESEAFYGHIIEYGSNSQPPRAFLIPAGEERREDVIGLVENMLEDL